MNRRATKPAAEYPKAGFNLSSEDRKRIQSSPFIFLTNLQLYLVSTISSRPIKFKVNIPCILPKSRFFLVILSVMVVLLTYSKSIILTCDLPFHKSLPKPADFQISRQNDVIRRPESTQFPCLNSPQLSFVCGSARKTMEPRIRAAPD